MIEPVKPVIRPVVERPKQGIGTIKKTGHLPDISLIRQNISKVEEEVKEAASRLKIQRFLLKN
ncbi:MAG: hypothetical protein U5K79_09655 [Cyclobacteriaceae bacterium]|nr:hypothetical protein [Cyclobacteriaceae bacterium]